jgi:hypothetical protein
VASRITLARRAGIRAIVPLLASLATLVPAWPALASHGVSPGTSGDPTAERYATVRDELLAVIDAQDPKIALAKVRALMKQDAVVARYCHQLVHEIGRHAYAKYGDFGKAIGYHDEVCNSGYLHGIIEGRFSTRSEDPFDAMRTVCQPYPLRTFLGWQCYHGVGHGLMFYTANDLPRALAICDSYQRASAREACWNGVFMENFNTEQKRHPSRFLRAADPSYPCQEQVARHKEHCYRYAPTYFLALHDHDYLAALHWCLTIERDFREVCAKGVGGEMMKEHISAPKRVEGACASGPAALATSCIQGMIDLYVAHHGAVEPAALLCDELEPSNWTACRTRVRDWRKAIR